MKSIFDRGFKYVPSLETDVGRTFARIRREQLKKKGLTIPEATAPKSSVSPAEKMLRKDLAQKHYRARVQVSKTVTLSTHSGTAAAISIKR